MAIAQSIRKPVMILGIILVLFLISMSVVYAKAALTGSITIHGEVDVAEGGKLSKVTIIDMIAFEKGGYSPALDTRGSVNIRNVTIHNAGVGVRASSGDDNANFQFRKNTIHGAGNSTGLILDVRMNSRSRITGNEFENQSCGIDISIDVVFDHLPMADRLDAFREFSRRLEKINTFINVSQPVCGGRG